MHQFFAAFGAADGSATPRRLTVASPPLSSYVVDYDHDGVDDLIEAAPANGSTAQPWFIRHFDNGKVTKQVLPDPGPATLER